MTTQFKRRRIVSEAEAERLLSQIEREPRPDRYKPTNARTCECGATVFAYTSLWWIAIVDHVDGWLLQTFKWSAQGSALDRVFYAASPRYSQERGGSRLLHHAVTGNTHPQLDHVNHNGHDCRKVNLRPCTDAENRRNRRRPYSNLSSKYKGVTKMPNGWLARINVEGKTIRLGTFGFESDAAICFNYHAAHLYGEFAKLNRIPAEEYMHD
jgi:hypothetical protein